MGKSSISLTHPIREKLILLSQRAVVLSSTDKKIEPSPSASSFVPPPRPCKTVQLPKISLPTFHGDLMEWTSFWSQFRSAVDSNDELTPLNKLAYLREAIKDQPTRDLLYSGAESDDLYPEVVALLNARFDKRREVHQRYCTKISNWGSISNTKSKVSKLTDALTKTVSSLDKMGQLDSVYIFTSLVVPFLPNELKMAWEIHTKDQTQVPSVRELIAFLRFQADVMPETSSTHSHKTKQEHPQRNQDSQPNRYRAEVHSTTTTPTPQSTYGPRTPFRYECRLCPGNKHPLLQCPAFNEMSIKLRGGPFTCYNCLAPGHQAADCRSSASCRSCGGRHHTLVHREQAAAQPVRPNQSQPQPIVNALAATHPSVSSNSTPTLTNSLMMTSRVVIKGEGGKQIVARALLDSGSSLSLVSNRVPRTCSCLEQQPMSSSQVPRRHPYKVCSLWQA